VLWPTEMNIYWFDMYYWPGHDLLKVKVNCAHSKQTLFTESCQTPSIWEWEKLQQLSS